MLIRTEVVHVQEILQIHILALQNKLPNLTPGLRSRCVRGRIIYTGYKGTLKPVVLELLV